MEKNVALVLSSGGARGFAHIGVIDSLQKHGYKITSVSGTSMGALVGGIFAAGGLEELKIFANSLDMTEVLKLTDFSLSKRGLVKGKKVIEKLKELVPDRNIEDLQIPYCAIATDIFSGQEEVFASGNLYDAIRASISIPTIFQPFKIGNCFYVDGGVVNPIPVNRVKRNDGDLLIIVDVNARIPYEKKNTEAEKKLNHSYLRQLSARYKKRETPQNYAGNNNLSIINLSMKSLGLMLSKISELTINKYASDLVIRVSQDSFGVYDFYKAKFIIEEGQKAAEKALNKFESE